MTRKINPADLPEFDLAEMLKTEQDMATYLTLVIEEGDVSELSQFLQTRQSGAPQKTNPTENTA